MQEGVTDPEMLRGRIFYRLGEFSYDHRLKTTVIGVLVCIILASLMGMGADWAESYGEGDLESLNAGQMYREYFLSEGDEDGNVFIYLVHHPTLNDTDEQWQNAVIAALSELDEREDIDVNYSWTVSSEERYTRINEQEDGFWAINTIIINGERKESKSIYNEIHDSIKIDSDFEDWRTGDLAISNSFDVRIQNDLIKAEMFSGPLSLIILGIVFGSIVAALLPIGVGLLTVIAAMGVTIWLSNITDVTQYSTNIISLIGIGVSIDYSLFLVNRFREELDRGRDIRTATAMSVATAGKAVFYSGVTVAIGLMGMLFFENTSLPSLGIGGTLAVSIAMVYSVIVLPAVLAMLGPKVNNWRVPFSMNNKDSENGMWARIARTVMKHPWAVLIPTLILLVGAGLPFLQAELSMSSVEALPPEDESRQGSDHINDLWPESAQNKALLMMDFDGGDPLSENNLRHQYRWIQDTLGDSEVVAVFGAALPDTSMSEEQVIQFWTTPAEYLTPEQNDTREYLREKFVASDITFISIAMDGPQTSTISRQYVESIRENSEDLMQGLESGSQAVLLVGGFSAYSADTLDAIEDSLPIALTFIFGATIILIYIQVGSVIIPFKAVIMNILSISASFGMLVVVFQWGWGSDLLGFSPQPIDSSNPIIMFCIVFGLSMDYEVLMLSRIHEEWERTGDNTTAVANGLQRTGRLITGAAAIMVVVFSSFGFSSVLILKQIGFGLALAILIDATIVRALLVPATMRLMGEWNWWTPTWLPGSAQNKTPVSIIESE